MDGRASDPLSRKSRNRGIRKKEPKEQCNNGMQGTKPLSDTRSHFGNAFRLWMLQRANSNNSGIAVRSDSNCP